MYYGDVVDRAWRAFPQSNTLRVHPSLQKIIFDEQHRLALKNRIPNKMYSIWDDPYIPQDYLDGLHSPEQLVFFFVKDKEHNFITLNLMPDESLPPVPDRFNMTLEHFRLEQRAN